MKFKNVEEMKNKIKKIRKKITIIEISLI